MMDDEKLTFLSAEWLESYKKALNMNEDYEKSANNWEGDFIFRIEPDGVILKEPVLAYMDLWHGKCREVRIATPEDTADFTYSASLENWKKLLRGETGPIRGLMSRKFRLKGNYGKVLRYIGAAQELVKTIDSVPTELPGE